MVEGQATELRLEAASIIDKLDLPPRRWDASQPAKVNTAEAFYRLMAAPERVDILAMLKAYADVAQLSRDHCWSISARPWWGKEGSRRLATVNGGGTEMFYLTVVPSSGEMSWTLRFHHDAPVPTGAEPCSSSGDSAMWGITLEDLVGALGLPEVTRAVQRTRALRQHKRRQDWHNILLAALVCPDGPEEFPSEGRSLPPGEEVARRYYKTVAKKRRHQREFKRLLLQEYKAECAACGLAVEILEAAHLIPDSQGGAASVANGRLLCPNHHRALDANLDLSSGSGDRW